MAPGNTFGAELSSRGGRFGERNTTVLSGDGKRLLVFKSHQRFPSFGNASPDQPALIYVVDVESRRAVFDSRKLPGTEGARKATLSPDGRKLFASVVTDFAYPGNPEAIKAWDLEAGGKELFTIEKARLRACSPDGNRLVGVSTDDKGNGTTQTSTVWDATTGEVVLTVDRGLLLGYSPDGKLLVGSATVGEGDSRKRMLTLTDAATRKELEPVVLPRARRGPNLMGPADLGLGNPVPVFSPDGSRLAVFLGNHDVAEWHMYDFPARKYLFTLNDLNLRVSGPARTQPEDLPFFTADGKQFVCRNDNAISTFDATTGEPLRKFCGHVNEIATCALSRDRARLLSVESNGTLKEWNIHPAEPVPVTPTTAGSAEPRRASRQYGRRMAGSGR